MSDFETAKRCFLQGLQSLQANDLHAAEAMFTRSLEIIPDRVSTLNNLSAIKIKLEKFSEAEAFARKAIALGDNAPEAWANLALALTRTDRHEEALKACDRALNCNASHSMAWVAKAVTLRALKRYDDALLACDHVLNLNPTKYEILYVKSLILKDLGRPNDEHKTYQQALNLRVAASPIHIGQKCATQKANILIVTRSPVVRDTLSPIDDLSRFCPNFPGQLAVQLREDFHFNYVFVSDGGHPSARTNVPRPDVILNNETNGELLLLQGNLSGLTEFIDSFGVPVVNHPTKAVQTGRDVSVNRLADIPGVLVPKTVRFSSVGKIRQALAYEIEDHFEYPIIARTLSNQEGIGMHKIDSRDALVELLLAGCPDQFFVTQFVDSRGKNQFYRKIRVAIVGNEIIPIRVDFDSHWNVHGRKKPERWSFYLQNIHLLDQEKRICNDLEAELGRPVIQSLYAIRERIPLDAFGIDFDVDPNGWVVFYEANATMNLFSVAPKEIPNPKEAGDRLKLAFQRFFLSLVGK